MTNAQRLARIQLLEFKLNHMCVGAPLRYKVAISNEIKALRVGL